MPRKLGPKLILSLTILIVAISGVSGYLNFRTQKKQLVGTMILGADQLSRSITGATWHAMLDDDRKAAYEIMRVIADKQGIDRIRMFNREGRLVFSTDADEQPGVTSLSNEVCASCHSQGPIRSRPAEDSRVRYAMSPDGVKTINMVAPIYNEPSCSNASCHAHSASTKVLGVVDVALRLDPVQKQTRAITLQTIVLTALEVAIGAAFVILFTRRFVATPIQQLIEGTQAVSAMELDRPIKITRRSQEIDELVDSFNRMRERLKLAVAELNEMQQTLESKVDERTRQLQVAQRKLVQSDRLATLGQLAASVAHEINNPVSGVLNLSMLLERLMAKGEYPPGREAEFRKYLSLISIETARVGRIVSDLLAFSRRSKPQRAPADLNKLVRTTLGLADHKLKLISAEVVLDLQENLPMVECDSSQIQQVILNLVLNGAQAMQPQGGGKLTIRSAEYVLERIPVGHNPRGVLLSPDGKHLYVANRLDDNLAIIDTATDKVVSTIDLGGPRNVDALRRGERLFYTAGFAFQGQFGCANCHLDATIDGLQWDLEPDGFGKDIVDNRSLENLAGTEPFKWNGGNADMPTECGPRTEKFFFRSQSFNQQQLTDLVTFVFSLPYRPNRSRLANGDLTAAQERGRAIFERTKYKNGKPIPELNQCTTCHSGPKYTNQHQVDVGTGKSTDRSPVIDVPQLSNVAYSAPYLHDGSARSLEEIWTVFNPKDTHGVSNDLTKDELNDLIEYLKTL